MSQLVSSNPATSDGLNGADDHMRLIKGALLATFPNFTAAALTSTQAQLDAAALAVNTNGVAILDDDGAFFKTNTTDGITNPAAGELDFKLQGNVAATFVRASSVNTFTWNGNASVTGTLAVTTAITGPGSCPIGACMIWFDDTLPTGHGTWAWANGDAISRTTYATLFSRYGTTWGVGNGTTTFNLPNMQEVVPVGKSTMGGASSPGLLSTIASGLKAVLGGGVFGAETVTLATANLPAHDHNVYLKDNGHTHNLPNSSAGGGYGGEGSGTPLYFAPGSSITTSSSNTGLTIGSVSGTANDNKTATAGSGTAHANVQPSRAVNYIIRIA